MDANNPIEVSVSIPELETIMNRIVAERTRGDAWEAKYNELKRRSDDKLRHTVITAIESRDKIIAGLRATLESVTKKTTRAKRGQH